MENARQKLRALCSKAFEAMKEKEDFDAEVVLEAVQAAENFVSDMLGMVYNFELPYLILVFETKAKQFRAEDPTSAQIADLFKRIFKIDTETVKFGGVLAEAMLAMEGGEGDAKK